MSEQSSIAFYDMFSCCAEDGMLRAALSDARVLSATVDKARRTMKIDIALSKFTAPVIISSVERGIAEEFNLNSVTVVPVYPRAKESAPKKSGGGGKKAPAVSGSVLFGRAFKGEPTAMSELNLDSGRVVVRGRVFAVESRDIQKRNAFVLNFDMTDNTGSVRVSKFITDEDMKASAKKIEKGMYITVSGSIGYNRYDGDITLEPQNIMLAERQQRQDCSENGKRVELHLHTKMSTMDALTDAKEAVNRAAAWGHRAIAITDHGVVQSFPDAMKAAKGKDIKVLYGVEAYYTNDVDDKPAIYELREDFPLDCEIAVFDIETTGLDSKRDVIIEIGAVIMKDGKELSRFQTFVNPDRRISQTVTNLTGITDNDVKGAPGQEEAVRAFFEFIGDRPLAAHNAAFDMGFMFEAAERYGLEFKNPCFDTMPMSQGLYPNDKTHKLDVVAARLSLPEFSHHRAADDAVTAGLILASFVKTLGERGFTTTKGLNGYIQDCRNGCAALRRSRPKHIIVLARTQQGIRNLYKLISKSHLEHFKRYPIMPKSLLSELREGLIIGSACEAGELFGQVVDRKSMHELERIGGFYDFLEIQPICNNRFLTVGERAKAENDEDLRDFNRTVVELGKRLGKPVVATGDVHFMDPEDEIYRHILLNAKEFEDADKSLPIYFKTTDEMLDEFSYLGDEAAYDVVVKNTNLIADMCDEVSPLPPKKLFAPKIENSAEDLKKLVYGRMHELYGENPPEIVSSRVDTELNDILKCQYDVIYMSAQKLVADSLAHGYLVGSRGSVGSSIVAYMSGITEVNSLPAHYRCENCKHTDFESGAGYGCGADMPDKNCPVCGAKYKKDGFDIPFETFLGFGGDKVPDIDLNFSGEYQANAHRYTNELFGADHVFRAGTIGTVAEKTAYGYVKKYLSKFGKVVTKAEENRLAQGCVGVKRTTGQHPGGLVVIPQDMEIYDFCPAQHPADDSDTDIVTTHFEYHCMEDNLLKLDELGHDDPTMIRMLEDMTGVDAKKIPLDDPETMGIFKSATFIGIEDGDPIVGYTGSIGIPEFGTGFTRQMLCDTKPDKFDTLVRLSGFSHGTDVWLGNAKDLIMSGTADISQTIGCRDDIMLYLISMGMEEKLSFKIMEGVRKGRGLPEGAEDKMREAGVPDWYIDSCKKIKYLFPKAHAVAYVTMAFRIAWFKVHEPLAFYSAYFYRRSQKDGFDAGMMTRGIGVVSAKIKEISENPDASAKDEDLLTTLIACYEFYKRGFEFAPVDLYKSDAVKFLIEGERQLRVPFVAISGLGESAARDLSDHRNDKEFISIEDLSASCPKVSKAHIEQLKALGALGNLPDTSQLSLF